jgi:SAM-dependent methyltransferase
VATSEPVLTVGNTAKLYCLERIAELASQADALRVVDLGAGDGRHFRELLRRHPNITYLGIEPSAAACAAARASLPDGQATIVQARAYEGEYGPADVVVSFSALDRVYHRDRYLRLVATTLAPEGLAFVNYDAGHFRYPVLRDRAKNLVGPLLAPLGYEAWYQSFVKESRFRALVDGAGLEIREALSFNTSAKEIYRLVPEERRDPYMRSWLEFELVMNRLVPSYTDSASRLFRTRNFVLATR